MIQRKPASNVARFPATSTLLSCSTPMCSCTIRRRSSVFRNTTLHPDGDPEELDNNKKGMSEVARNARQASRYLDELLAPRAR